MIEHMDRAVRPSLFDVHADPDLVWAIVLANLMSPFLWDLSERVRSRGGDYRELNHYIDGHFTHLMSKEVAEQIGTMDLDLERQRLGAGVVDGALAGIVDQMNRRESVGALEPAADVRPFIEQGIFPSYFYATIDESHAFRRLLGRRKHKPIGVTVCLDEAALVAALIAVLRGEIPDHLSIFGSSAHYTAFIAEPEGAWWFNGKHEFFAREEWRGLLTQGVPAIEQRAFDARVPAFDRILSALGSYVIGEQVSSIPREALAALVADLAAFFGEHVHQIATAELLDGVRYVGSAAAGPLGRFLPSSGPDAIRARVRETAREWPNSLEAAALYCFRDFEAPDPTYYVTAAMRSVRLREVGPGIRCRGDALRLVASIEGTESVFRDRDRLAMPDEVLLFGTASDRDRALLLYTLLQQGAGIDAETKRESEVLLTAEQSYVRGPGFLIETTRLEPVEAIEEPIVLRLARR